MGVREIVVVSGKGGTGKTTLTASLVPCLGSLVIADCDVDAPDLHILLKPELVSRETFSGSQKAAISDTDCTRCGLCTQYCRFHALPHPPMVEAMKCEGCGVCAYVCPQKAITMNDAYTGDVFHSMTSYGPMKHARLIPGEETSGKLVTKVRAEAKAEAEKQGLTTVLIDGSPGIGC
ncbi:MAG: 4Fe-4S binding protein, partial [Spirochaetales bacterium]|nr:4Fe-4S binding protein [Spirochaetales bacterium]